MKNNEVFLSTGMSGSHNDFRLDYIMEDTCVNFRLMEISAWDTEGKPMLGDPRYFEQYMTGMIKFDGCSHLTMGDAGYMHLCGVRSWKRHCIIMEMVYKYLTERFPNFMDNQFWENEETQTDEMRGGLHRMGE